MIKKNIFSLIFSITLSCCLSLFPLQLSAKIIEASSIHEVISLIDKDSWVLIDLDNTLFEAKQALGHNFWFGDQLHLRMDQGMTENEAVSDFYPFWIRAHQVIEVQPIEKDFIPILMELQNKQITVMGLTHRFPVLAQSSVREVNSLGFDFTKTAPSVRFQTSENNKSLYYKGILFTHGNQNKGDLFWNFLSFSKTKPRKIIFFDDSKRNVEELEKALTANHIDCLGIYYTAIQKAKKVYDRDLAEIQYKFLDKVLSNEAASVLLKNGILE